LAQIVAAKEISKSLHREISKFRLWNCPIICAGYFEIPTTIADLGIAGFCDWLQIVAAKEISKSLHREISKLLLNELFNNTKRYT